MKSSFYVDRSNRKIELDTCFLPAFSTKSGFPGYRIHMAKGGNTASWSILVSADIRDFLFPVN